MAGILHKMPDTLTAGESLSVTVAIDGKTPDAGYTLVYRLAIDTVGITAAGVDNGEGGWTVSLTAAQTIAMPSGILVFDALVTLGTTTELVDRGNITVTASPLFVSQWAAVLEQVDAAIAAWATSGGKATSISVDGMSTSFSVSSLTDLQNLRAFCIRQRNRERGTRTPYRILTRFA
jgi:hypothetical protein